MKKNPFKFGSIVDLPYFTNRKEEIKKIESILASENHLIIISPRRYGKTSLIYKVVKTFERPVISLDLQLITSSQDFAAQLLKRIYRCYPFERVRQFIKNFRVIPSISVNPYNNEVDISFQPSSVSALMVEDVLNLIENLSTTRKKAIVVFDEFQELVKIEKNLPNLLRSVMQTHQKVNYIFSGSQESLIREIFEKKKSPFYHFGILFPLGRIPYNDFMAFLNSGFAEISSTSEHLSESVLKITECHPYYTQQLAFFVWEIIKAEKETEDPVEEAVSELLRIHDMDYERLWNTLNKTDMKILIGLSLTGMSPISALASKEYDIAISTAFSSLKRLMINGLVNKITSGYEIDDPFFKRWIRVRRLR